MREYEVKDCIPGRWLIKYLSPGREVLWATIKNWILMSDFTTKARIWFSIICYRVSPTTNLKNVPL